MITKDKFLKFYPNNLNASKCWDEMLNQLYEKQLLSELMMVAMLATVRIENGRDFLPRREIITPELAEAHYGYQTRVGKILGNTQTGDGYFFRGSGYPQLTGRWNFQNAQNKTGLPLITNPDLLLDIHNSVLEMVLFAQEKGVKQYADKQDWDTFRHIWNGGSNGLVDFKRVIGDYLSP